MKLTGRRRYRTYKTWTGYELIVLQVEFEAWDATNLGYCVDCERRLYWRDATTEDLTEMDK